MINIDRCIISWPLLHSGWPKKQQGVRCKVVSGTLWKRHTNDSIHITLVNALQLGNLGKMSGNSRHHLSCSHIWMWRVQCWAGWIVLGPPGGVGTPLPLHADHHHIPTSKLYIGLHQCTQQCKACQFAPLSVRPVDDSVRIVVQAQSAVERNYNSAQCMSLPNASHVAPHSTVTNANSILSMKMGWGNSRYMMSRQFETFDGELQTKTKQTSCNQKSFNSSISQCHLQW